MKRSITPLHCGSFTNNNLTRSTSRRKPVLAVRGAASRRTADVLRHPPHVRLAGRQHAGHQPEVARRLLWDVDRECSSALQALPARRHHTARTAIRLSWTCRGIDVMIGSMETVGVVYTQP